MTMTYPVKIEFMDYPSGSWQDWTEYLVSFPSTNQRVESENDGEAGVIVFDTSSVTFRYEIGNPVYDAFSIDLTDKQRYVFRISYLKSDKTYIQRMEGIADFSTIEWPENEQDIITFDVIDKISALGILSAVPSRVEHCFEDRILAQQPGAYSVVYGTESIPMNEIMIQVVDNGYQQLNLTEPLLFPGELIQDPRNILKPDFDKIYYAIITSTIVSGYNFITVIPNTKPLEEGEDTFELLVGSGNNKYLAKELYGADINNIVDDTLVNLKGIEVIRALYNQAWPGETITLVPSNLNFNIPSEYAVLLTDANPLGDTPLAALSTILNSVKPSEESMTGCYFYINKNGNPVIHAKSHLDSGIARTLNTTKVISRRSKAG
jgi:hypothetical protein